MKAQLVRFREAVRIGNYEEVYATGRPDARGVPKHVIEIDVEARLAYVTSVSQGGKVVVPFENILYLVRFDAKEEKAIEGAGGVAPERADKPANHNKGSERVAVF